VTLGLKPLEASRFTKAVVALQTERLGTDATGAAEGANSDT
jgi:hypothetical protein